MYTIDNQLSFSEDAIILSFPSKEEARKALANAVPKFAAWARELNKKEVRLTYPNSQGRYYPVLATMGVDAPVSGKPAKMTVINTTTAKQIYNHPLLGLAPELQKLVDRFQNSDRPMFLLSNDDDRQLWVNQLACDMIESSGEEAIQRSIRNYWEAESHRQLHLKLRDTSLPFDHSYQAILNDRSPTVWFSARSHYTPIEINGRSYRISVNQHFEIIGQAQLQTAR